MASEEGSKFLGSKDHAALCAFTGKTGWDTAIDDLSRWSFISHDKNRVVQIDFGGSGEGSVEGKALECGLPKELWTLSMIQEVKLRSTKLSGNIPEITTEHQLDKLVVLDLAYNGLNGKLPRLGLLPNLRELFMHKNALAGTLADGELEECKELELVNLSMNRLTGVIPAGFVGLTKLHSLHLYINRLTGVIPVAFMHMPSLQDCQIGHQAGLQLPPATDYPGNEFKKWMDSRTKVSVTDLKIAPITKSAWASLDTKGDQTPFPVKEGQKVHREGALLDTKDGKGNGTPFAQKDEDILAFDKYAEVLVERLRDPDMWPVSLGIYAQWGAGKSSLLRFILKAFEGIPGESEPSCFVRFLRSSILGSGILEAWASLRSCFATKICGPAQEDSLEGVVPVTCILASFDAWLFADSDVLWAFLISKIFDQVEAHPCFGKGAVRYFRLRKISLEITMERLCFAAMGIVIVVGLAVALGLTIEAIGGVDYLLAKALAFVGLAGVPISIVLWAMKVMPAPFKGQGEVILSKAKSMHESVGSARLGFMSDVQEEIQILFDMIKDRSTEKMKYALVVSIDNLDRCPHRNIVKVLEAVHLLLELDQTNVVVILALDPRVIISAIEADLGPEVRKEVSGSEYLDKIIHVPFCVPFGTQEQRLRLTDSWLGLPKHEGAGSADQRTTQPVVNSPTDETKRSEPGHQPTSRPLSPEAEEAGHCAADPRTTPPIVNSRPGENKTSESGDHRISPFHTSEEIEEFHRLCQQIVTTPRKMKRIMNIYGIQRALAKKQTSDFRSASAIKLLRWAALCEFWPFRTACLVGSAKLEIDTKEKEHLGDESAPLAFVYTESTSRVMKKLLNGKHEADDEPRSGGFSRSAARRLLGMDESDQAFLQLLRAPPLLCVGDFMERPDNVGLLRFSFNLNPAMVATVGAWVRSEFS